MDSAKSVAGHLCMHKNVIFDKIGVLKKAEKTMGFYTGIRLRDCNTGEAVLH